VLLRGTLRARFSDAQCGFKAVRRDVAEQLLPLVHDDQWFFDTELLVLAERAQLRIHEVAVDWVDDADSRVDIVRTATDDLRGIARLSWSLMRRRVPLDSIRAELGRTRRAGARGSLGAQTALFICVGVVSTIAYALLYFLLRYVLSAQGANALALLVTAIGNTAANRRLTFGIVGPNRRVRQQLQGLGVFAVGLGVTSGALWLFEEMLGADHPVAEIVVLTVANLLVTIGRFVAMRGWIFRPRKLQAQPAESASSTR
jgi:putative flippase GtrA